MRLRCGDCGETYQHFDGHECKPSPNAAVSPNGRHLTQTEQRVTLAALQDAVDGVKPKSRNQRWRERNPDRYRASQRDLMRKRRAKHG